MSLTIPTQASALRVGGYVLIDSHPCKIINMSTSKTGKHGSAKINFIAVDIFTEKRYEHAIPSTHNLDVPIVNRYDYQLIDIDGDNISYLDSKGEMQSDLRLPNFCNSDTELAKSLVEKYEEIADSETIYITVLSSMDINSIKSFKVTKN